MCVTTVITQPLVSIMLFGTCCALMYIYIYICLFSLFFSFAQILINTTIDTYAYAFFCISAPYKKGNSLYS